MGLFISLKCLSSCLNVASSWSLDVGYLFWQLPIYFVDRCSEVGCNFGVFMGEIELQSLYSAILNKESTNTFSPVIDYPWNALILMVSIKNILGTFV